MAGQYSIDSIGATPYFMGAYNFPNANYMTVPQVTQTTAASDTTATAQAAPAAEPKKEEKKDNSTAKLVVGTALVLGAAYLCKKAHGIGNGSTTMEKIVDGFGQWGKSAKNWFNGTKDKIINPEKFSVAQIGDQTVCTVPGKKNIIKGVEGATEKLGQIGATTEVPAILDSASGKLAEGIKIKNGNFVHEGQTFIVKNGKIVGCEGMTAEAFKDFFTHPKTTEGIQGKTKIQETLAKFLKGETGTVTKYSHTQDGVARLFEQGTDGAFNLRCGVSNRFNVNSDAVNALRHDNSAIDTALKGFAEHKTDSLKLASAEFTRPDLGTLYINNGEITSIKWTDGNVYQKGSEKWKALMQTNKEVYENILKDTDCLQNKVYQIA